MYASEIMEEGQVRITEEQAWAILKDNTVENPPYMVLNLVGKMVVTEFVLEHLDYGKRVPVGMWFDEVEINAAHNYPVEDIVLVVGAERTRSRYDECMTLEGKHFDWYVPVYGNELALTAQGVDATLSLSKN